LNGFSFFFTWFPQSLERIQASIKDREKICEGVRLFLLSLSPPGFDLCFSLSLFLFPPPPPPQLVEKKSAVTKELADIEADSVKVDEELKGVIEEVRLAPQRSIESLASPRTHLHIASVGA
jgi:hypothetical protein